MVDGILRTKEEVDASAQRDLAEPGDYRFKDLNKDGRITEDDRTFIGNPQPDFFGGFHINLEYAGFDLNAFFQGEYGAEIYNVLNQSVKGARNNGVPLKGSLWDYYMDYSNSEYFNDNIEHSSLAKPTSTGNNDNHRTSTFYIEDGSYLRLKNIQLGYNFPSELISKMKADKLRIYVGASNLFTWTKYTGMDPEVGSNRYNDNMNGVDNGNYPQTRKFMVGLKATF